MSKQLTPVEAMKKDLTAMQPQFQMALPNHIPVEKFLRVTQTAIQTNPKLMTADKRSLFGACMKSAQDGLLPDGREAALVTFRSKDGGDTVQYMPMVAGILKKVRNSGELASITSQLVYEKDNFRYWVDADGEHLTHEPNLFDDRGKIIGVYALAKTKDGAVYIEVLTKDQVDAVRNASRSKDSGPWSGPFAHEMWKKTAIRRLSKRLPMSTDLDQVIRADDADVELPPPQEEKVEAVQVEQEKPARKTKPRKLEQLVEDDIEQPVAEAVIVDDNEVPI
jgi:recombination protein RecT